MRAARDAGADVRHGVSFRSVARDRDGRVVGAWLREDDEERLVRCRWLVGADGRRSRVARAVGAPVVHRAAGSSAFAYAFVGGLPDSAYHNWFRPGVAAGLIPTNGGMANVWAGVAMDELRDEDRHDVPTFFHRNLRAAAPQLAEEVGDGREIEGIRLFAGMRGETRRANGPGWLLVGDAASMEDPVGAHGMTKALVGAEFAARAIVEAAASGNEHAALARYATIRTLLARRMLGPIAHMTRQTHDLEALQRSHMAAGLGPRAEWEAVVAA